MELLQGWIESVLREYSQTRVHSIDFGDAGVVELEARVMWNQVLNRLDGPVGRVEQLSPQQVEELATHAACVQPWFVCDVTATRLA